MASQDTPQLLLGLGFKKEYHFGNFVAVENDLAERLKRALFVDRQQFVYLAGAAASGKTHLSIAVLNYAQDLGMNACYLCAKDLVATLSGSDFESYSEYLMGHDLVLLDDVDAFAGNADYERVFFNLYNGLKDKGRQLIVSAKEVPRHSSFLLPDLKSRLQSGLLFILTTLSDAQKKEALVMRAKDRGIDLNDELVNFIYARSSRSLSALLDVLDQLDHAQLVEKRVLTVPFVKKVLGW